MFESGKILKCKWYILKAQSFNSDNSGIILVIPKILVITNELKLHFLLSSRNATGLYSDYLSKQFLRHFRNGLV